MSKVFIYGLFDPRKPKTLRYIGKTNNCAIRLNGHISAAKKRGIPKVGCYEWILALLKSGVKPAIQILEETDAGGWKERERFWIKRYKNKSLLNKSAGGAGPEHGPRKKLCPKCGSVRTVISGRFDCRKCRREYLYSYTKRWRKENRGKYLGYRKNSYSRHKEEYIAAAKTYYKRNRKARLKYAENYRHGKHNAGN